MRSIKRAVGRLAKAVRMSTPLAAYPYLVRRDVVGIFYHAVSDERLAHIQHLYPPERVGRFEAALRYIKKHYHPVSDAELEAHRLQGRPLPRRALHLSFDDGFAECFTVARPLLLQYGIPCTFYITTDWIDNQRMFQRNKASLCIEAIGQLAPDAVKMVLTSLNNALETRLTSAADFKRWILGLAPEDEPVVDMAARMLGIDVNEYLRERQPYMTRQQIEQLQRDGFTIGAHTRKHTKLALLPPGEAEAELVESARIVQGITGTERVSFSFPYSATGLERSWLADLRRRHPFLGLFYDTRDLLEDEPFIVNRVWAEKAEHRGAGRETNLPALLHAAYRAEAYRAMHGWLGQPQQAVEEPG
ncbi:MAG: polysaccharide deacetylase family protein [Anaerolineales bacterium]|nr:polysaccharide deacetylase family protein [Anaerolineales bacterium]